MAQSGFEQNAADYERARPTYPPAAIDFLRTELDLSSGRRVADVGAGTGKLTRALVTTGATVLAVEPVAAMRTQLAQQMPEVAVYDATAEALPFDDASVDAVVCGQSFHWFATATTLHEFARVVPPGGPLALVWNVRDHRVAWVQEFTDLLHPFEGDRPDHNTGQWRKAFEGDVPFTPLGTTSFVHEQAMTPDLLAARAASTSFVGALDPPARSALLGEVRRLGARQGQSFAMPYRTDVYITRRLSIAA